MRWKAHNQIKLHEFEMKGEESGNRNHK